MYKDTVTLFNRYKDSWYPTILRNVDLNMDKAAIVAAYGQQSADNAVLHVRYKTVNGSKKIGNKAWISPKEWKNKSEDELSDYVTFASGKEFDFIWLGDWQDETPVSDDFYGTDGFYHYMNSRHDFVFTITSVSMYSLIPHFEITGK